LSPKMAKWLSRSHAAAGNRERAHEVAAGHQEDPELRVILDETRPERPVAEELPQARKIWVVYGRDEQMRKALFEFLRAVGLHPMSFDAALQGTAQGAPYVGDVLEHAFQQAQAVAVLLTGDDVARLRREFVRYSDPECEREPTPQARPNVLFEAGMAMGRKPEKTVFVQAGFTRPFSDISGRHVVRVDNSADSRWKLAKRLESIGCAVDLDNPDWMSSGNLEPTLDS